MADTGFYEKWFRPSKDFVHPFVEVDLRVGGCYRVGFQSPEGILDVVKGEFLEVKAPRKLVYTWAWEEPNEHAGIETQVTVDFLEAGEGTELVLTHERFTKAGMKERHLGGWCGALSLLDETVIRKIQE